MTLPNLSSSILNNVQSNVETPRYDRSRLKHGIVHIGVGGFHRAHEALYMDDLFATGETDWAIYGVGIMPQDEKMNEAIKAQECLYTLIEQSSDAQKGVMRKARIIGAITEYEWGYQNPEAVFQKLADPSIKIVTLTVTENGYYLDASTGDLNQRDPAIQHDLAHPKQPHTLFGYLAEGLNRRRLAGLPPVTLLSCDNMQENGHVLKKVLLTFCRVHQPDLAHWIESHVSFPCCMVDRITPATTENDRAMVQDVYHYKDACPVLCEPFSQWVIEDNFCNGRPPLEKVGVLFTSNVGLYEAMKIRLLNGTHSAMGYLGYLCGYTTIDQIANASEFKPYLQKLMDQEVSPLIPDVPGVNLTEYKRSVLDRFSNALLKDQTLRICMDGSGKIPKYILPTLQEQLARQGSIRQLSLCVASWMRFLNGVDEQGQEIPIIDPQGERLKRVAQEGQSNPDALLNLTDIFGNLKESPRFVEELRLLLAKLYTDGAQKTLAFCCGVNK
jgi:mannitol 2-dehydrogenase